MYAMEHLEGVQRRRGLVAAPREERTHLCGYANGGFRELGAPCFGEGGGGEGRGGEGRGGEGRGGRGGEGREGGEGGEGRGGEGRGGEGRGGRGGEGRGGEGREGGEGGEGMACDGSSLFLQNDTSWVLLNLATLYWKSEGDPLHAIECIRRALHYSP